MIFDRCQLIRYSRFVLTAVINWRNIYSPRGELWIRLNCASGGCGQSKVYNEVFVPGIHGSFAEGLSCRATIIKPFPAATII